MIEQEEILCVMCGNIKSPQETIRMGIGFGMSGDDYDLCADCLSKRSISELVRSVAALEGHDDLLKWMDENVKRKGTKMKTIDQPHPTCLTCYWWSRAKQAKMGECNKALGIQVTDANLEHTRTAYPKTLVSESCEHHTPKL